MQQKHGRAAIPAIIIVNIAYSLNWFNISSLYYLIGPDLQGGVSGLGTLTSSFFLGIGLLQIPVGILSAKLGPSRVLAIGTAISALAVFGESVSTLIVQAIAFRFIAGAGLAFVFAPSIVMITRLNHGGSGGGVGMIQSSFGIGGLLGLFGWTLLAPLAGWRLSLALSGILLLLGGLTVAFLVPKNDAGSTPSLDKFVATLTDKSLILVGLSLLSPNIGSILVFSFLPYHLENNLGQTAALAGLVASAVVVVPILSALWGGKLYDKTRNPRLLMITSGLAISASLALCATPFLAIVAAGVLMIGLAFGIATTAGIATARDLNPAGREHDSLAVAWISAISLTGAFWPPLIFSYLAGAVGYTVAWLGGATLTLPPLIPTLFLKRQVPSA